MIYSFLSAVCLALDIGANDAGSSVGISYGSGALSMKKAVLIASLLGLFGSLTLGFLVIDTIGAGIISMNQKGVFIVGVSSIIWLTIVLWKRLPISTTQSIIGAIIGYGLVSNTAINFSTVDFIILSWVLSPLLGIFFSSLIYYFLIKLVRIESVAHREKIQSSFLKFQVFSAALLAFANGANNVGVSVGFLLPIFNDIFSLQMFGGVFMSLGIVMFGPRIIRVVGSGITSLTPAKGFAAQLAAGFIILIFTLLKMPVSGMHILVGSIMGIGLIMTGEIKWKKTISVLLSWIFTLPISAGISFLLGSII